MKQFTLPIFFIILFSGIFLSCNDLKKSQQEAVEEPIEEEPIDPRNDYTRNRVESYTRILYSYKFGELDTLNGEVREYGKFDKKGNLIEKCDSVFKEITKNIYKDTFLIESAVYEFDGKLNEKHFYTYTSNSVIDSMYLRGNFYEKTIRYYDRFGKDSLFLEYNDKNKLMIKTVYDEIGLKSYTNFDLNPWSNTKKREYKTRINDDKYTREYIRKNDQGKITLKETCIHDELGRLKSESEMEYSSYGDSRHYTEYYYIGDTGLIEKIIGYKESGDPSFVIAYTYTKF